MQVVRHPLVYPYDTREPNAFIGLAASKDNRLMGFVPQVVVDPIKGEKSVFACKRLGLGEATTPFAGRYGAAIYHRGDVNVSAWAPGALLIQPSVDYNGTACGSVATNEVLNSIVEVSRSSVMYYVMIANADSTTGSGYFIASDSVTDSTFSGDTTNLSVSVTNITGLSDTLYPGQPLSGTNIQALTRVATVVSATEITMTLAATGTGTTAFTKTHLAKIIDADFPTNPMGNFVDKDGYLVFMDGSSNVWHTDLNSVYSISASSVIPANIKSGQARGCALVGNLVAAIKSRSIEYFRNAGNPIGSVLSRADPLYVDFGCKGNYNGCALVTTIENNVYFVGNGEDGRTGIYVMNGTTPQHISTSFVDSIIPTAVAASNDDLIAFSGNVTQGLKILYLNGNDVSAPVSGQFGGTGGIAFYPDLGIAMQTVFPFDIIQNSGRFISRSTTTGKTYFQDSSGATPAYLDDSVSFDCIAQFDSGDKGTGNTKSVSFYELIADTQTAGTATLYFSDDDWVTVTAFTQTFDLTQQQKRIYGGGSYRGRRGLKLLVTGANRASRVRFIDEGVTVGPS